MIELRGDRDLLWLLGVITPHTRAHERQLRADDPIVVRDQTGFAMGLWPRAEIVGATMVSSW